MKKRGIFLKLVSLVLMLTVIISAAVPAYATAGKYSKTAIEETRVRISDKIVEIAKAEIGFYESDLNKFTKWYYGKDIESSWCCIFVSWCAAQAGVIDTAIPQRSACSSMRNWFRMKGEYYPVDSDFVPRKGDIVFYNTACDDTDEIHHVEIVTENGFITRGETVGVMSVGGNTSNQYYSGCQYVMEKFRPVDGPRAQVVGYCRPSYEKSDTLRGKYLTFVDSIRNEDMRYSHSKYISLIYHIEVYWNNFLLMLEEAKIDVENWFIRVFTGKSPEDEDAVTEPVTEEYVEDTLDETAEETTTAVSEVTEETRKEDKFAWFKDWFKLKNKEEETTTETTDVSEVTEETTQTTSAESAA